jgi:uncharacterized membrane protein YdjX (TVP38/TMEM64 family)
MLIDHLAMNAVTLSSKKTDAGRWCKWGLALAGLALLWWFHEPVVALVSVASDREAVSAYLAQFGLAGPLLLGLLLVLQVIIAAIPGEAFMIGGGYVYGFGLALCINVIASVAASQAAFLLARWAGRPVVERLAPANMLDKWNQVAAEKGLVFFLFAFMLPIFPGDLMNYVAGLSGLSGARFFIANLLGRLPRIALITAIGAYGVELSIWIWALILLVAAVMFLAWRLGLARKSSAVTREA